jgi:hypothetical protein
MRTLVLVFLLVLSGAAAAGTATFGSRVLVEGDSMARVFEVAGKPDRIVQLENKFGGAVAERFEYYRDGKTISVTVSGGRVQRIDVSNG